MDMRGLSAIFAGVMAFCCSDTTHAATRFDTESAVPPGVTFESIGEATVFADGNGMTLYLLDNTSSEPSSCDGECEVVWPIFEPHFSTEVRAKNWSIVKRADGRKQWTFNGKPIHTYAKNEKPGDNKANNIDPRWQPAWFRPANDVVLPPGIIARELVNLPGWGLVNFQSKVLYVRKASGNGKEAACRNECARRWIPELAPAIASPIGDFTVVNRGDGTKQWAFRGAPLFSYANDLKTDDLRGLNGTDDFEVATLLNYPTPSNIQILRNLPTTRRPAILATSSGHTLYARGRYGYTQTFNAGGDRGPTSQGRAIGTRGCDSNCLTRLKPLPAQMHDAPIGYWTILNRDDGTRQWAYQGYALYTYVDDRNAGDMKASELFDITEERDRLAGRETSPVTSAANAMYWRVAAP
jgi:predicted lipoprotein with Yx(FWY)xxD motif